MATGRRAVYSWDMDRLAAQNTAASPHGRLYPPIEPFDRRRLDRGDGSPHIGLGFTATKKIGGAVQRNRAKRRLREAARAMLAQHGVPGSDYVFIARMGTTKRAWDRLLDDVKSALTRLATPADGSKSARPAPISPDLTSQDR